MSPTISVIFPSRGRPELLRKALLSVIETAQDPTSIECLVRLDADDEATLQAIPTILPEHEEVYYLVGPRYKGYLSMAEFWNSLARQAKGEWFVTFNDDAVMAKQGWDFFLKSQFDPNEIAIVLPRDGYNNACFPILPRKIYDILGHITLFCGVDTYLLALTGAGEYPQHPAEDIVIQHLRGQMISGIIPPDQTFKEAREASKVFEKDWAGSNKIDDVVNDAATLAEWKAAQ